MTVFFITQSKSAKTKSSVNANVHFFCFSRLYPDPVEKHFEVMIAAQEIKTVTRLASEAGLDNDESSEEEDKNDKAGLSLTGLLQHAVCKNKQLEESRAPFKRPCTVTTKEIVINEFLLYKSDVVKV